VAWLACNHWSSGWYGLAVIEGITPVHIQHVKCASDSEPLYFLFPWLRPLSLYKKKKKDHYSLVYESYTLAAFKLENGQLIGHIQQSRAISCTSWAPT
jgi:hypothetical protein